MIVMKFGGTSVQDGAAINQVVEIVSARLADQPVVVVSAMTGVTDALLRIARMAEERRLDLAAADMKELRDRHFAAACEIFRAAGRSHAFSTDVVGRRIEEHFDELERLASAAALSEELTPRAQDAIVALGEQLSSLLVAAAMAVRGISVELVDARQLIVTDDNFTVAAPQMPETGARSRQRLLPLIESGLLVVTQGFIGATAEGITTTLGRGGSDYSAAIIGAAIGAEAIEIWTDVDGMMTADPRIVPGARRLDEISYDEAAELSWFGAKVLHPSTVTPAVERNIPLRIYNTRNPSCPGTRIVVDAQPAPWVIKSIALKRQVATLNVRATRAQSPGDFLSAIFEVFDRHQLQIDLMTTSSTSASFALRDAADLEAILQELRLVGEVKLERNKAMVCVVGDNLNRKPRVMARLLMVLDGMGMGLVGQGASEISLVCVIDVREAERAVRSLHDHFFAEEESNSIHLQVYKRTWTKETSDQRAVALQ